jgi:predicted ester cyclase
MGTEENTAVVLRYWEQCWNHHEVAALRETHFETFAQNDNPIGIEAFSESLESFFASFPDVRVTIDDVVAVGDKVLTRVTYSGTQTGRYQGNDPTGRAIRVTGLELFLLVGDRVIHHWHEMDHLAILLQLGLAGPTGELEPRWDALAGSEAEARSR